VVGRDGSRGNKHGVEALAFESLSISRNRSSVMTSWYIFQLGEIALLCLYNAINACLCRTSVRRSKSICIDEGRLYHGTCLDGKTLGHGFRASFIETGKTNIETRQGEVITLNNLL
jgi:hypothetical protein